jgi:hypothetical protein
MFVATFLAVLPGVARAAGPANDNFASAIGISTASGSRNATSVGATTEAGEPATCAYTCSGGPNHTVWYAWTAPSSSAAYVNTCSNASFDTMVAVYTGSSLGSLARVADDNDAAGCGSGAQSRVSFSATSGTVYRIQIDGVGVATGTFTLSWKLGVALSPGNDAFANATPIDIGAGTTSGTTLGATTEPGEPATCVSTCSGGPAHTVWYLWGDSAAGATVTFDTCANPTFDTMLAVYSSVDPPSFGHLTRAADSNDAAGCGTGKQSRVSFTNTGSTVYYIQVDGVGAATGTFTLTRTIVEPNDSFAHATAVTQSSGSVRGANTYSTTQSGEPATCASTCSNGPNHTVWYTWTAPKKGTARFDTCSSGGGFDTMLAVYTGSSLGSLTRVEDNDDATKCGGGTASRVSFAATLGVAYRIQVDGVSAGVGPFTLTWDYPPKNDNFSRATAIMSTSGTINGSNLNATPEPQEPCDSTCGGGGGGGEPGPNETVWYKWTAPSDGDATIGACSTGTPPFALVLVVYTGTSLGALKVVASNDTTRSGGACPTNVTFNAKLGTAYHVQIDDIHFPPGVCPCSPGPFTLTWNLGPANDAFINAAILSGTSGSANGTNVLATAEPFEPASCVAACGTAPNGPTHTGWYEWTAPADGTATFDTCSNPNFDTTMAVYTGYPLDSLTRVTDNEDAAGCGTGAQSKVTFQATSQTFYYVQVDGFGTVTGTFTVSWSLGPVPRPPNDSFSGSLPIAGQFGSIGGTNAGATVEASEPATCAFTCTGGPNSTVWYMWTAPKNGTATLDVCGANFDTMLAVYTGSAVGSLNRVTDNDDSCGLQSSITFPVTANTVYRIQVDGWGGATGTFTLVWSVP